MCKTAQYTPSAMSISTTTAPHLMKLVQLLLVILMHRTMCGVSCSGDCQSVCDGNPCVSAAKKGDGRRLPPESKGAKYDTSSSVQNQLKFWRGIFQIPIEWRDNYHHVSLAPPSMARGGVSPVTSESKDDIPISQEDTKFLRSNAIVIGNDKITTKTAPNFLYNRPTNKQPKLPTSLNKKSLDLKVQYSSKTTNYTYTVVLVTASKIILTSVNSSQILVYNHSHQLNQKSQLFNMPTVDETTRRTRSAANNSKTNHTSLDASKPKDPKKKSPMATKIIEELPTDEEFMPSFSDDEDGASNVNKHISEMNNGVPEKINEEGMNVDPAEPEKPTDEEMKDQGNDSSTSSPIKKRSKREVLSALITPKVTPKPPSNSATKRNHAGNEKPKETPTANANSKKATSPKTAQDPPEKTPSPKGQSSKTTKPASVLKNSKYKSAEESEKKQPPKPHDH
jgi:hypothetical protein